MKAFIVKHKAEQNNSIFIFGLYKKINHLKGLGKASHCLFSMLLEINTSDIIQCRERKRLFSTLLGVRFIPDQSPIGSMTSGKLVNQSVIHFLYF